MKNSKKIIIIAAALVLASVLALCGCMHLISGPPVETKEYNQDEMSLPSVIEETPTAQSEMQKKFGAYGKEEIGENGEKIFRLFTEDQIEESLSLRENGERRSLTYEEIVFIINDSIRMYFEYDKILVTDFLEHKHERQTSAIDYDMKIGLDMYGNCEVYSFGYAEIEPYHGNYSDKDGYTSALETYHDMIYDIERIILDRLRIHDTRTECYCKKGYVNSGEYTRMYGILFDGGELETKEEYKNNLVLRFRHEKGRYDGPEVEYPMILASDKYVKDSGKPYVNILYLEGEESRTLFPTEQLCALRPDGTITLSGKTDERIPRYITIEFDRWTDRVTYTEKKSVYETILKGGFALDKSILYLHFGSVNTIYFEYADGKFRIYDDPYEAYFGGEYDAEIVFEYSSAYNEEFVFPDAFIYNLSP